MNRPRLLLADDHKIVLEGLRNLLKDEFEIVGTVEDGRALVSAAKRLDPDVIVVDISMPLLNGIEAIEQLRKAGSRAKVIFLTMHSDMTYATRAFEVGASGYVLKHSAPSELITAIRQVLKGESFFPRQYSRERFSRKPVVQLTPRQREVLQLLAEGRSAKEIASILNISSRTAEFHKYRMMHDLRLKNNAELIQYAIKHGVVTV